MISAWFVESVRERIANLDLTALETRKLTGHLIEVFKIFKSFDEISRNAFS